MFAILNLRALLSVSQLVSYMVINMTGYIFCSQAYKCTNHNVRHEIAPIRCQHSSNHTRQLFLLVTLDNAVQELNICRKTQYTQQIGGLLISMTCIWCCIMQDVNIVHACQANKNGKCVHDISDWLVSETALKMSSKFRNYQQILYCLEQTTIRKLTKWPHVNN